MAPLDEQTKTKLANALTQAAIAGGATQIVAGSLEALVAAVAGGLSAFAGVFVDKVAARDTRRATELFESIAMADDDPVEFVMQLAQQLHDGDEEILIQLRAIMRADLEAASAAALPAIARIGREYLRGRMPSWVARAWLRVLSEASSGEVAALGELAEVIVECLAAGADVVRELRVPGSMGVVLRLGAPVSEGSQPRPVSPTRFDLWPQWQSFGLRPGRPDSGIQPVVTGDAPRVFELLRRHGVASDRSDLVADVQERDRNDTRPAIRMTAEAARALATAFAVACLPDIEKESDPPASGKSLA